MRRANGFAIAKPPESSVILTLEQLEATTAAFLAAHDGLMGATTHREIGDILRRFKVWLGGKPLKIGELQNYFRNLGLTYSHGRIQLIHQSVKKFFKWLEREHLIEVDPMQFVVCPKGRVNPPIRPYTHEEYLKLLDAAMYRMEDRWLVVACYNLGVRASGAAMMKWTAVNWDDRVITTVEPKMKRLGIQSVIPFEPGGDVEKCLLDLHLERNDLDDSFPGAGFICKKLAMLNCCNPWKTVPMAFQRISERAGVERLGSHSLRRAFCTNIANYSGLNAVAAMKMTGHKSYEHYARYITVDGECLREGLTKAFNKVKEKKVLMKQLKEKND